MVVVDTDQERRFDSLQRPCADTSFLSETHGISWPPNSAFEEDFSSWLASRSYNQCQDGKVNRYAFEWFLESKGLLTLKYASARLGMECNSLEQLIRKLPELGIRKTYQVYSGIIDVSLKDDLIEALPKFRFRSFDYDSFCSFLHEQLHQKLDLTIDPLFCETAKTLGKSNLFASTWDNITLKPLSLKHSMWLDFGKPIALPPDRCSKLLFANHEAELSPYVAGDTLPTNLADYQNSAQSST